MMPDGQASPHPDLYTGRHPRFYTFSDVHLWQVDLDAVPEYLRDRTILSHWERRRANAYLNPQHGQRWQHGRAALRHILGAYLEQPPAKIKFRYGPMGKPQILKEKLSFNLSHSHSNLLIAVGQMQNLGVDIECRTATKTVEKDVAKAVLSAPEQAHFEQQPAPAAASYFHRLWVRKEAVLKANGCGLSLHPSQIKITRDQAGAVQAVAASQRYYVYDLPLPWPAALATPSPARWQVMTLGGHVDNQLCRNSDD